MRKLKAPKILRKEFTRISDPYLQATCKDSRMNPNVYFTPIEKVLIYSRLVNKFEQEWRCELLLIALEIQELIAKLNKVLPSRFIRCNLTTNVLRIPTPRVDLIQFLRGRAPPLMAVFVPVPHKVEMGSCARSDLAVSAY